jgi:nucleoside-diphosphate-sugar epimerase
MLLGKKTILITGATGFIGSNFINTLDESHYNIIGVKHRVNSAPRVQLNRNVHWTVGALENIPLDLLTRVDVVVHLASHSANHPYDSLINCIDQNVTRHLRFIDNAYKSGVRRFLLAGSCFEYGDSGMRYEYIPVDAPLEPKGSYPVSKAMFFLAIKEFFKDKESVVSYQRIFQVYGEGEAQSRFWPTLKSTALSGKDMEMTLGEQVRDFIHVEDVAVQLKNKVISQLSLTDTSFFEIENLASGTAQTLKDFAEYWWNLWEAKGKLRIGQTEYRANEIMRFVPEIK